MAGSSGSRPVVLDPHVEPAVGIFLAEIAFELDRPQFDRPLAFVIAPHRIGHHRQNFFAHLGFARQIFRRRHVRHFRLMLEARLVGMKRHQHGKDRMAVLARGDAPCGEALAVADAVDVVDDRNLGIARQQEIGVHGMRRSCLHRAHGGDQRLADHLAAEHALPADLRGAAAEQIHVERLEVEKIEQVLDGGGGGGHGSRFRGGLPPMTPGRGAKSRRGNVLRRQPAWPENFSGGRWPAARSAHQTPAIATRRKNTTAR